MGVFAFAFAAGVLDLFIHKTIPEPPRAPLRPRRFWQEVLAPFGDAAYRPWLLFNACWTFGMILGGTMATVYFVDNLELKNNFLGASLVLILLPLIGNIFFGKRIGLLVDQYGVKRTLWWGHGCWAFLPLFWLFATPQTALWWVGAGAAVGGVASTAALNAANKLITRLPPSEHVSMYVALSGCVGSLAGGLGALAAAFFLKLLGDTSWDMWGHTVLGFHVLFVTSFLLRSASTLLIRRVQEPPERDDEEEDVEPPAQAPPDDEAGPTAEDAAAQ